MSLGPSVATMACLALSKWYHSILLAVLPLTEQLSIGFISYILHAVVIAVNTNFDGDVYRSIVEMQVSAPKDFGNFAILIAF